MRAIARGPSPDCWSRAMSSSCLRTSMQFAGSAPHVSELAVAHGYALRQLARQWRCLHRSWCRNMPQIVLGFGSQRRPRCRLSLRMLLDFALGEMSMPASWSKSIPASWHRVFERSLGQCTFPSDSLCVSSRSAGALWPLSKCVYLHLSFLHCRAHRELMHGCGFGSDDGGLLLGPALLKR